MVITMTMNNYLSIDNIDIESLERISSDLEINYEKYMNENGYWLSDYLEKAGYPPKKTDTNYRAFELIYDENKDPVQYDFENAKILHHSLNLSPELAANGAFWTVLAHHFIPYIRYRGKYKEKKKEDALKRLPKDFCFQEYLTRRNRRESWLIRLWAVADLTFIEENVADPYEYTRLLFKDQDLLNTILDRDIFSNKKVVRAFLEIYKDRKDAGKPLSRKEIRDFQVFLEALSAMVVIETFSLDDLRAEFRKFTEWEDKQINEN